MVDAVIWKVLVADGRVIALRECLHMQSSDSFLFSTKRAHHLYVNLARPNSTCTGSWTLAGTFVFGGVRFSLISACEAAVHVFVKLFGCKLNRFWKLNGTLTALNPRACRGWQRSKLVAA